MAVNNLNSAIKYDPLLTGVAKRFPAQKFEALELAPVTGVPTKKGNYTIRGKEFMRDDGDERAIGAQAKETFSSRDTTGYETTWKSKRHAVYWKDADQEASGDTMQTLKENAAFVVKQQLLLGREREIATLATTTSSYTSGGVTNYAAATSAWDASGTTVMADVAKAVKAIKDNVGVLPNKIYIPAQVQIMMATQAPFSTQLGYNVKNDQSMLTPYGLPRLFPQFGLEIVTLHSMYDTSGLGGSTTSLSSVWSDNVIVAYNNPNWRNRDLTFMTTFMWDSVKGSKDTVPMWSYPDNSLQCDWVEGEEFRQVKVIEELAGYMITGTLT